MAREVHGNARYCPGCHSLVWDESANDCPHCHGALENEVPSKEEISHYSREAHNHDIDGYNRKENALCFVVIGAVVLIIGLLFIFLSLKKKANVIVGVNFASFAFVICAAGISIGATLLIIGIVRLVRALRIRRQAASDIAYLEELRQN